MSGEDSFPTWLPMLGSLALKSLLVFLIAGAALLALRRASASARHLVCLLTLTGLLALPVLSLALPGWRLAVLKGGEPTPALRAAPPETGGGGGLEAGGDKMGGGKAGAASSASTPLALTSSSSRCTRCRGPASRGGRTPVSGANKGVGFPPLPLLPLLTAFWLTGALLALLRPGLGLWGIVRLFQASRPVSDASALALADECASALGLSRTPALRQAEVPVPMTWGWRRPVVLLPLGAQGWPEGRLRAVLLHELAHVRRRDWLSHRFADLVCALYWFHPLVWLTARRLRAEGEIACDDLVLTSGVAAPDYARHLLDVARALSPTAIPLAAIAMARTARIEGRLKMILDHTRPRRALTRRALLLSLTLGAASLVALAMLRPAARAQAAPLMMPATAPAPAPHLPEAPGKIARYFISLGPPYRIMKQEGNITWTPLPLAFLPKALPPGAKIQGESTLKHLKAAPRKAAPRAAQSPAPVLPTVTHITGGVSVEVADVGSLSPLRLKAARATLSSASKSTGPPKMVFSSDLTINGTTLLAGVTDADKPGGPWWSADGAVLPTPVYDTSAHRAENHAGMDTHNVSFAIHLPPAAQDITVQYELPQSNGFSSDGFWPTKLQENENRTEAQMFAKTNGARVVTAAFPASLKEATLGVGIASGAWKTAATDTHDTLSEGYTSASSQGSSKFIFSPVSMSLSLMGGEVLTISTDSTDDLRVVAVTTRGQTVLPDQIGGNSAGTLDQITAWFSLPLAQIKEIRVETRPFRWVEFKDVALRPTH